MGLYLVFVNRQGHSPLMGYRCHALLVNNRANKHQIIAYRYMMYGYAK